MIVYTKDGVPVGMRETEIAGILERLADCDIESVLDGDGTCCPSDYEHCLGIDCGACWIFYIKHGRAITEKDLDNA